METVANEELQLAFDFVQYTNRNVFLTGKAGTGKTTFLHNLKKISPKRMIVVAPTGVAAINAGGVTIHSFFQLPFCPYVPAVYLTGNTLSGSEPQKMLPEYRMSREKANIIRSLDLLVIDEISMVRADTLDAVDAALRRYKNRSLPFGGVQLLMIGDLQQLAPVVKDDDRVIIDTYYHTPFFFGSRALLSTDYITIELNHIYRQSDRIFIDLLNKVRDNKVDTEVLDELNKRYIPGFDPDTGGGYITLTTHNYQSQAINDSKLEKLPGTPHTFSAIVKDEFPELSYPTAAELTLKTGAQVMFVKNDISHDKLFFNGKIGKVTAFEDDAIMVMCPGDDSPIRVEMAEWQNMKFSLNEETKEIEETPVGTFTQYPLRLAWAVTIHKSQGLTFDRAVIDARSAFAHGQVYVALSRCRTLEGLVLSSMIDRKSIIDDPVITGFITETTASQPGRQQLDESKRAYQSTLLRELFDFAPLTRSINYCLKLTREHKASLLGSPQELFEKAQTDVKTYLTEVSERFENQLSLLLRNVTDAETDTHLQERVMKACEYFSERLTESVREITEDFTPESDNKVVRKSVNEALERLRKEITVKTACLDNVKTGFTVSRYLGARAMALIETPPSRKRKEKTGYDTVATVEHPVLFGRIREWRNKKAGELDVPHYMILPQRTMSYLAANMPRTAASLGKIKGMGKKTMEKYGEELLEIIITYCLEENIEPPEEPSAGIRRQKKVKADTKKISFDLFREGKTVSEIAAERGCTAETVENHLSHYISTGEIKIEELVPAEKVSQITSLLEGNEGLRMGPVKEALGDSVTWGEIRMVKTFILTAAKKGDEKDTTR